MGLTVVREEVGEVENGLKVRKTIPPAFLSPPSLHPTSQPHYRILK